MDITGIIRFMAEMGISRNPANIAAVVRFVQRAEGNFECFGAARDFCDQGGCAWRGRCADREVEVPGLPPLRGLPVVDELAAHVRARPAARAERPQKPEPART